MRRWRCRNTRLRSLPSASRPRAFEPSVWRKKRKARRGRIRERGPPVLRGRNLVIAVSASAATICDAKQCRHHKDLPCHSSAALLVGRSCMPAHSRRSCRASTSTCAAPRPGARSSSAPLAALPCSARRRRCARWPLALPEGPAPRPARCAASAAILRVRPDIRRHASAPPGARNHRGGSRRCRLG